MVNAILNAIKFILFFYLHNILQNTIISTHKISRTQTYNYNTSWIDKYKSLVENR